MRLGNSIRRRRSKKPAARKKKSGGGARRRKTGGGFSLPSGTFVRAGIIGVVGGLLGYVVATQIIFPAPSAPDDLRDVPALAGLTEGAAVSAVSDAGLAPGRIQHIHHPRVDSGRVMGQAPLAGQLAIPGDSVWLTVSLGPERRRVPDVARLRGDRATALLEAAGFDVAVDSAESPLPRGRIIEVMPAQGTQLALPGTVRLTMSVGPRLVLMPSLLGMAQEAATDSLTALGLTVAEVEEIFRFGRDQGRVVGQDPAEGIELERGSAIRLVVGRRGGAPQND